MLCPFSWGAFCWDLSERFALERCKVRTRALTQSQVTEQPCKVTGRPFSTAASSWKSKTLFQAGLYAVVKPRSRLPVCHMLAFECEARLGSQLVNYLDSNLN